jgi:cephalosporin hydroxylase
MGLKNRLKAMTQQILRQYEDTVIDRFHNIYYNGRFGEGPIFDHTYWLGVPCLKCPLDLWIYQEIIGEIRPDLILETGTHLGGSALFLAHLLDSLGSGSIVTIDIRARAQSPPADPVRHRIVRRQNAG